MVNLWFTKIKLGQNELEQVPPRYYDDVLKKLVDAGLYSENGEKINAA